MSAHTPRPHTKWPVALILGLAGAVVVALVFLAFLWPAKTSAPQHLPLGITGPASSVTALETALGERSPGTFDFTEAADRTEAVAGIERRETYGAIILSDDPQAPEVLTAPAGSPAATQLLTAVAGQLQVQAAQQAAASGGDAAAATVAVTAVVPFSENDAAGTGLAAAAFPLTMGGIIGGVLISLLVAGPVRRLAALAGFGAAGGVVLSLLLHTWFSYLQSGFWLTAGVMGLSILATSAFIVGCVSLIGTRGIAIGAVLTMFIANPLSAAAAPWQFLPEPWGLIGQFMVPGAASSLMRTTSYFPAADASLQWLVLSGWVTLGVALTLAGHFRNLTPVQLPEAMVEHNDDAGAGTGDHGTRRGEPRHATELAMPRN